MYHQPSSIDFPKVRLFCGIPKLHPQLSLLTFLRFFCFVRCYSTIRCTFSALLASSCVRRCVATAAATQLHSLRCDIHHASCCAHVFLGSRRSRYHCSSGAPSFVVSFLFGCLFLTFDVQRHCVLILSSGVTLLSTKPLDQPQIPNSQATNHNVSVPLSLIRECRIIEAEDIDVAASERYTPVQSEELQQTQQPRRRLCARVTWTDLSCEGGSCSVCIHPRNLDESIDFVREYIAAAIMHDAEESEKTEVFVPFQERGRKSPVLEVTNSPPAVASVQVAEMMPSLPDLLVNDDLGEKLIPVDSKMLTETDLLQLVRWLPPRFGDRRWRLVFSAGRASAKLLKQGATQKQKQDGFSIQSMYGNMRSCRSYNPVVSVIRDEKGFVFGVFSTEPWRESSRSLSCGETFVFKLQPETEMFRWSREGEEFLRGSKTCISVGGGKAAALWLDDELNIGSSDECRSATCGFALTIVQL